MRGVASSSFGGHACAVQFKSSNCNALPVPFAKTGYFLLFWGVQNGSKKRYQKRVPKRTPIGPQNGSAEGAKSVLKVGSRKGSQKGHPFGRARSEILLLFIILWQGWAPQEKVTVGYLFGVRFGSQVGQRGSQRAPLK